MSEIFVDNIKHQSSQGSGTITLGASGETISIPSGVTTTLTDGVSGDFKMNSGFGSVATVYGVRAWVHFNGQGTPSITASGNVSGITDDGVGLYTISFSNNMPDGNYVIGGTGGSGGSSDNTVLGIDNNGASDFRLLVDDVNGNSVDRTKTVVLVVR